MKRLHGHILLLVFAIAVAVLSIGIYVYMYRMIDAFSLRTSTLRSAAEAATVNKQREQDFLKAYQETAPKWARLPGYFVSSQDVVSFIEAVEALGGQSGSVVTLSSLDADNLDSAPAGKIGGVRAKVDAEGSWSSVMRTLALAETLPYEITVNNLRFAVVNQPNESAASSSASSAKPKWDLSFDIQADMIAVQATTTSQ